MSTNNLNSDENEVHYVYGDQEFILGENEITPEIRDILCSDGTRAILVDGQYIVADNQTILLQDSDSNLTQFYINDNSEGFVVGEETSNNSLFESTECVQLVDEETNDVQQIIYYTNEDSNGEIHSGQNLGVEGIQDEDGNIYPLKRIRLEGQLLNFEEFVQQNNLTDDGSHGDSLSYTILEDSTNLETDESHTYEKVDQIVDISKITGRNLITGQTVTLDSYMEKLKKRLNRSNSSRKTIKTSPIEKKRKLNDLLDKKIAIGTTKTGKKIIGKIIHVEKRETKANKEQDTKNEKGGVKILVKKSVISTDKFEQISKTLGGVMEMESVRKKLENKNLIVKLIEKRFNSELDCFNKVTSFCYGFMELIIGNEDKWRFVTDSNVEAVFLGDRQRRLKFPVTTNLTILITYEKAGNKSIRVNLNPQNANNCSLCSQTFKSQFQLKLHLQQVHKAESAICEKPEQTNHPQNKLFSCSKCNRCFSNQTKLQKHLPSHDVFLRPLECTVCEVRCASEWALKKHLMTHTGLKPFACDVCSKQFTTQYDVNFHKKIHFPEKHFACNVCMRTFSRHSNLLRHMEIHQGAGALYKCEICSCSYNYISSLTRHMVQNHLEGGETPKKE